VSGCVFRDGRLCFQGWTAVIPDGSCSPPIGSWPGHVHGHGEGRGPLLEMIDMAGRIGSIERHGSRLPVMQGPEGAEAACPAPREVS
jgi:hypothetical protein